ncbi:MAG: AAA family ATPase [Thermoplasmata archaeon]
MPDRLPPPAMLAIEGVSHVGKSTLARGLAKEWGSPAITEAYDRLGADRTLAFRSDLELRQIELELAQEDLQRMRDATTTSNEGPGVILDTDFLGPLSYTRGLVQLGMARPETFDWLLRRYEQELARQRWRPADYYLYLDAPPALLRRRAVVAGRAGLDPVIERHLLVGAEERQFFLGPLQRILGPRLIRLSTVGRIELVRQRALKRLSFPWVPLRDPQSAGRHILDVLSRERKGTAALRSSDPGASMPHPAPRGHRDGGGADHERRNR